MKTNDIVSQIHPERASAEIQNTSGSPPRHRSPSSSRPYRSRRHEKHLRRIKILGGSLGVTLLILMVLAKFEIEALETKNSHLTIKARKQEALLEHANQQLDELRQNVHMLVDGRIPNLYRLEFDKTIPVEQQYMRNINFTLTGVEPNKHYEYRMVMHNASMNVVTLLVNVFLFDELGIQVGSTRNAKSDTLPGVEYVDLQPGEIRSYSSKVPLDRSKKPHYFLVTIE